MHNSLIILFVILVSPSLILAQRPDHPIDKNLEECLGTMEGQTTYGSIECLRKASEAWDVELNKVYKELMTQLSESQKEKLRASQRIWISYRDAENDFSGDLYGRMQGSMYRVMSADSRTSFIRNRVMELQSYLDVLNGE